VKDRAAQPPKLTLRRCEGELYQLFIQKPPVQRADSCHWRGHLRCDCLLREGLLVAREQWGYVRPSAGIAACSTTAQARTAVACNRRRGRLGRRFPICDCTFRNLEFAVGLAKGGHPFQRLWRYWLEGGVDVAGRGGLTAVTTAGAGDSSDLALSPQLPRNAEKLSPLSHSMTKSLLKAFLTCA